MINIKVKLSCRRNCLNKFGAEAGITVLGYELREEEKEGKKVQKEALKV